jgi:hypothetical protein
MFELECKKKDKKFSPCTLHLCGIVVTSVRLPISMLESPNPFPLVETLLFNDIRLPYTAYSWTWNSDLENEAVALCTDTGVKVKELSQLVVAYARRSQTFTSLMTNVQQIIPDKHLLLRQENENIRLNSNDPRRIARATSSRVCGLVSIPRKAALPVVPVVSRGYRKFGCSSRARSHSHIDG